MEQSSKLLNAAKEEVAALQEERKGLQKEVIHLHGLLELEQEGCTVQEVAVQKAVIIERDQVHISCAIAFILTEPLRPWRNFRQIWPRFKRPTSHSETRSTNSDKTLT